MTSVAAPAATPTGVSAHTLRRQKSRQKLIDAANALFAASGVANTTLESIAERANLHVQTLYRHFANKDDVVAAVMSAHAEQFELFMSRRTGSAIDAWRDWVEQHATLRQSQRRDQGTNAAPTHHISTWTHIDYWRRYERALARGLAEDLSLDMDRDLRPLLLACALVGGNNHVALQNYEAGTTGPAFVDALLAVVDTAAEQYAALLTGDR